MYSHSITVNASVLSTVDCEFKSHWEYGFRSSVVERLTVNQDVAGSIPAESVFYYRSIKYLYNIYGLR